MLSTLGRHQEALGYAEDAVLSLCATAGVHVVLLLWVLEGRTHFERTTWVRLEDKGVFAQVSRKDRVNLFYRWQWGVKGQS